MTSGISRRQFIHGTQSLLMVSALPATVDDLAQP